MRLIVKRIKILEQKIHVCFKNECDWYYDCSWNVFDLHDDFHNRKMS
jgi:hypothetical protein